jgi:hypothetical protein
MSTRTGEELAKGVGKGPDAIAVKDVPGSARRVYRTLETPTRCSATAGKGREQTYSSQSGGTSRNSFIPATNLS